MIVYVTGDDLEAALKMINEGLDVDWSAADGTPVTLRPDKDADKNED